MSAKRRKKVALPGHVRCTLQLYVEGRRFYGQIPGLSLSRIRVSSMQELETLWREIQAVIDQADWRTRPVKENPELATASM